MTLHHQPPTTTTTTTHTKLKDSNISAVTGPILTKLERKIPTDMVTFVQATFVLTTFVHTRNI